MGEMTCSKCGHVWYSRVEKPLKCPHCAQPRWWEPKRILVIPPDREGREADARLGNQATSSAPGPGPSNTGTRKRDIPLAEVHRRNPELSIFDPQHPDMADEVANLRDAGDEPDMDELRAIAAGQGAAGLLAYKGAKDTMVEPVNPKPPASVYYEDVGIECCPYKELDPETNEWVYCALGVHSPKVKHVPGRRVSA